MKRMALFSFVAASLLGGCVYRAPLSAEHRIPIDPAVLGLWESIPGEDEEASYSMLILKYSDTEYLVHYPVAESGLYYRCYPIEIGGISCIQLQVVGTAKGPLKKGETKLFHVISYEMAAERMTIRTLNPDVISDSPTTSEALRQAFLDHKDAPDLFVNPESFRRVRGQD